MSFPPAFPAATFGETLRFLRKREHLTQDELGRAVGYSREQIARLESGSRLPDLAVVAALFIPALGLQRQPKLSQRLLELAGQVRAEAGETQRITVTRSVQTRTERSLEIVTQPASSYLLPAPLLPLLGRAADLEAVRDLLLGDARLVTLLGAPGIGKTRLALEAARLLKDHFSDGSCFVALDSVQDARDVTGAVALALGLTPSAEQSTQELVRAHLASRNLLLVLDNCEHILESAVQFGDWLSAAPKLRLLCTSRTVLDLYGEHVWDLSPLALPDLAHLPAVADLAQVTSVQLFVARARAANAAFRLDAENALPVAALCAALDGLPLALEIAAARVRDLSPQELLQQIVAARHPSHLSSTPLGQAKRNVADRHRTLQAAIAWSVRLLSESQRAAFLRLGVMAGGCELEAAEAVCGADVNVLNALSAASLLRVESGRVILLETLRAFAFDQLAADGLLDPLRRAHAVYFAEHAQAVFKGVLGAEQSLWLSRTRANHENFRAALRFALENGDGALAVNLAGGLWWFWERQGFVREAMTWLEAALRCPLPEPFDETHKRRRAMALNGAGAIAAELNEFAAAMRYHEEGLALRRELRDKAGISTALHNMGLVAQCQGEYARAIALLEESLSLSDPEDVRDQAIGFANLGTTATLMYDLPAAQGWLERALEISSPSDTPWENAFAANCLATVYFEMGDLVRAEQMARHSLTLFEEMGDALYLPEPQLLLANLARLRGDSSTARALCAGVLRQYQEADDEHGVANALHALAWLALDDVPSALGLTRAEELFREARVLRGRVKRHLSPLEQIENQRLQTALDQRRSGK